MSDRDNEPDGNATTGAGGTVDLPAGPARTVLGIRGGLGFLTRLPVGAGEPGWEAFRRTPVAFVVAGYVVGALVALPLALPWPAPTVALLYVVAVVAVTGIVHLDGVADLGDAAVVHGDAERRRAVLKDTDVGVGGTVAAALVLAALALGALALAGLPWRVAVGTAVAAEVGAKLGMAVVTAQGRAAFDGMGAQLTRMTSQTDLLAPTLLAVPAAFLAPPSVAPALALLAGVGGALAVHAWARRRLGGVTGDVLGAANELGRVTALHAGVVAWTLS